MEIKADQSCLPEDKQLIQFQIAIEEIYGKWREGYYNAIEGAVYEYIKEDNGKERAIIHCILAEVVRWEDINEPRPTHWRDIPPAEIELVTAWSKLHNKKKRPN